jgi:hypothetical protein
VNNHPKQGSAGPTVGSSQAGSVPAAYGLLGLAIGIALFALASILGILFSSAVYGFPSGGLA